MLDKRVSFRTIDRPAMSAKAVRKAGGAARGGYLGKGEEVLVVIAFRKSEIATEVSLY